MHTHTQKTKKITKKLGLGAELRRLTQLDSFKFRSFLSAWAT